MTHGEHYIEVHINVEPWENSEKEELPESVRAACVQTDFRRGKLLMAKGGAAPDAFFTWRGTSTFSAELDTRAFIDLLKEAGINVIRYKMEITLVDSRESDRWELL